MANMQMRFFNDLHKYSSSKGNRLTLAEFWNLFDIENNASAERREKKSAIDKSFCLHSFTPSQGIRKPVVAVER